MEFNGKILHIRAYHGGLGGALQYSTLPERYSELGYDIHLLKDCSLVQPFRNEEIKKLVWGDNPYIKGESNGNWDLGDHPGFIYENKFDDFIKNIEYLSGLEPKNSLPKIYYKPNKLENILGLIELSALSHGTNYNIENVKATVFSLISQNKNIEFKQVLSVNQSNNIILDGIDTIKINGIFELTDYIHNCKMFISLLSGSHTLACSIKHFKNDFIQYCLVPEIKYKETMQSKHFIFPTVNYLPEYQVFKNG